MFAIFNNTEDADRRNESPLVSIFSEEQKKKHAETELKVAGLKEELDHLKATALDGFEAWACSFEKPVVTTLQEAQLQNGVLSVESLPGKFTGAQFDGVDADRLTLKLRPEGEKNL